MKIKEFRVTLPMTVEEYQVPGIGQNWHNNEHWAINMFSYKIRNWSSQVAQLYSVAEASKNETGGGEGVEVNFDCKPDICQKISEHSFLGKKKYDKNTSFATLANFRQMCENALKWI